MENQQPSRLYWSVQVLEKFIWKNASSLSDLNYIPATFNNGSALPSQNKIASGGAFNVTSFRTRSINSAVLAWDFFNLWLNRPALQWRILRCYNRINELHVLYSTDGFETLWEICINWTDCRELIHARMSVAMSRYKRHTKSLDNFCSICHERGTKISLRIKYISILVLFCTRR